MASSRRDFIREIAVDRADDLFRQLLGEPNTPRARQWRKGSKDSFSMEMRGVKRGVWIDHEAQHGGDILDFIAVYGLRLASAKDDFPAVLREAAARLGLGDAEPSPEHAARLRRELAELEAARQAEETAEAQRRARLILARQRAAQSLEGTPAEAYLRSRGITRIPPVTFATYEAGHDPELVVWAVDDAGAVQGGQGIALTPRTPRKMAFGNIGGYVARLPADAPGGPLFIAEGPETALTVWQATGCETWAVYGVGNFAKAPVPTDRSVILCPDADAPDSPAGKTFLAACRHHARNGARLYIAASGREPGSKADLNDVLQDEGAEAVRAALAAAQPFHDPDTLPSAPKARERLSGAVGAFFDAVAQWHDRDGWAQVVDAVAETPAPLHLLEASLGLGKTTTTLRATAERIRALRKQGDGKGAAVIMVPMHRLSEQVKADLQRMAPELRVEILRGVEAQDPNAPDEPVCKQLDLYRKRQRLMDEAPCGTCPFAESCLFLRGKEAVADIYVQAHGALASKPAPLMKWRGQYLDHVIIDESPLSALLRGTDGRSNIATGAWLSARLPAHPENAADLAAWRARMQEAVLANGDGPVLAAALDAAGLTPDMAREAAGLEWARKVEVNPKTDKTTQKQQRAQMEQNLTVRITAGIWRAVAELLDGGKGIGGRLYVTTDAERGAVIELQGVTEPAEGYHTAPMLALDATADAVVAEAVLRRQAARVDVIRAAEPMLHLTQDSAFSGSKALLLDSPTEKGRKACGNNRRRLEAYIARRARQVAPQRVLVVGNKGVLELLDLPDNAVGAHFNALRGLNDFQDVACAVIVGRPQPNETAINRMASAIFDRHIDERIDRKGMVERRTVNGPVMGRASMHPDPDAQRVLTLTRDAEVEQAIGRLRAVNRTAPVDVVLLSDAVIRQTVELAPVWAEQVSKADPVEQMLLDGGIGFMSPAHAAKAYPARWKSLNAAKYALGDLTGEKRSLVNLYDVFSPVVVSYRLPRAKASTVAILDARRHPVPQASLERVLGPLAHFEVLETVPTPADSAVSDQVNRLESIEKRLGYRPQVTVRPVQTPVFVAGQVPAGIVAEALRRRGWPVVSAAG